MKQSSWTFQPSGPPEPPSQGFYFEDMTLRMCLGKVETYFRCRGTCNITILYKMLLLDLNTGPMNQNAGYTIH